MRGIGAFILRYPLQLALGVVVAFAGVQTLRLRHEQAKSHRLGLEKLTLQAQADTTRLLDSLATVALRKVYGDSLQGVQRLVSQEKQRTDALSKALKQVQVFAGNLQVRIHALEATVASGPVTEDTAGIRHGEFRVDSIRPYHVTAAVDLPRPPPAGAPPRPGILRLGISQDPLLLRARLGCLPKNDDGLRPASLALIAPAYATVQLDSLTQSPEVCNVAAAASHGRRLPGWMVPAAGGIGALLALLLNGSSQ